LNFRPHGPESSGDAPQVLTGLLYTKPTQSACTPACTSQPENDKPNTLDALATALLALPPSDRARLAELLNDNRTEQPKGTTP
jgi:hypothetical protein